MIRVDAVSSRADLKAFIHLPFRLYKDDPHWVPPLLIAEWERFNPKKNPFFEHAEVQLYLARRGGRVAGRIAAIEDALHIQTHGDNLAFFGFFEAEDEDVAAELLKAVEAWAKQRGRQAVRGPINFSMFDGAGFQINAFDTDPYVMTPYNPPSYPGFVEASGYSKVKDLYAYAFVAEQGMGARISKVIDRVAKRNKATVLPLNLKDFDFELAKIKAIYNAAWEKNWGFVKMTDHEVTHLASEMKPILDPDIALFVEVDGHTAGFSLCIPNINQVFKKINGRLLPFGIVTLLRRKKIIDQARLGVLGLAPEYRNRGLELLLINETYLRGVRRGYKSGECSWVLEDNEAMNRGIEASGAKLYKNYRIYERSW